MERRPVTRQRSTWEPWQESIILGVAVQWLRRRVGDGELVACIGNEPMGWHMSLSHRRITKAGAILVRYPTWDEIAHAREELLPLDVGFVMHLPTPDEYVSLHDTTFHLHEHPERTP
jgi:hypothetical protein